MHVTAPSLRPTPAPSLLQAGQWLQLAALAKLGGYLAAHACQPAAHAQHAAVLSALAYLARCCRAVVQEHLTRVRVGASAGWLQRGLSV